MNPTLEGNFRVFHLAVILVGGFILCARENYAVKVTNVVVPRYANWKSSVHLSCKFDLEGLNLYSLKWYKDEYEFYRYMPENTPHIQTFPVQGIQLDLNNSNLTDIILSEVNFTSSGTYKCEVSTDSPSFQTVVVPKQMTVYAYPDREPSIDGIQKSYTIGDYVTGNCSIYKTSPAARLSWFINREQVESWYLEEYPTVKEEHDQLYSSALGLRFQLQTNHFLVSKHLELRCKAEIADLPPLERMVYIVPTNLAVNQKLAQGGLRNSGITLGIIEPFGVAILIALLGLP